MSKDKSPYFLILGKVKENIPILTEKDEELLNASPASSNYIFFYNEEGYDSASNSIKKTFLEMLKEDS